MKVYFHCFAMGLLGVLEKVPNLSLNFLKDPEHHQGGQGTGTDVGFSEDAHRKEEGLRNMQVMCIVGKDMGSEIRKT